MVLVEAVAEDCFVGWKEERARKAARKLERNGRGGCWLGEGMVGGEASLETWDGCWPGEASMGRCGGGCWWLYLLSFAVVGSSIRPDQRVVLSARAPYHLVLVVFRL